MNNLEIKKDMVNHPPHYNAGKYEVIDIIEDTMESVQYIGYLWGNILKYLHRWPRKNGIEDLKKAQWYLNKLITVLEKNSIYESKEYDNKI